MKPMLIVISAPSGGGKSTLCDRLLQDYPEIVYSVSCTTREPRGSEEDGIDYHFLSRAAFDRLVADKAFLEHAEANGNGYGTLVAPIREAFAEGLSVILDIDVQGAGQIRDYLKALPGNDPLRIRFVDIFIMPPSLEVLRARLEARGEDSPETIERRMKNAQDEIAKANQYRFRILNDDLDAAYRDLCGILDAMDGVAGEADRRAREAEKGEGERP